LNAPPCGLFRPRRLPLCKRAQFPCWEDKFQKATIPADYQVWEYKDGRFVDIFQAGKVDGNFAVEIAHVFRTTRFASHRCYLRTNTPHVATIDDWDAQYTHLVFVMQDRAEIPM